uniref:transposase n=1 Tax=Nafulsella turpanensis TaxID=1265690 RepID=UPI001F3963F7
MSSLELKVPEEKLEQGHQLSTAHRPAREDKSSRQQRSISARKEELQEIASRQKKWSKDKRPGAGSKEHRFTSNKTHYSPVDPDARIAVKPGKPCQLCYFNQLSVDTAHHVITHTQADLAEQKDSQCLPRIIEAMKGRLTNLGLCCGAIAADAGYCSGENLHLLEEQKIEPFISVHGTYKGGPEGFTYHREEDYWLCPNNRKVTFHKIKFAANMVKQRQYFTRRSDCKGCPFKESCIGKQHEKRIDITYFMDEYTRAIERVNSSRG